jgi:hypothetical protein
VARSRGLAADLPMFIPGFGAYVRWTAEGVTANTRALVSLAGPLAGALGGAVYRAFDKTPAPDMAPSYGVTAYFVSLLAALAWLAALAPIGAPAR